MRKKTSRSNCACGVVLIECLFVLPLFILLCIFIADITRYFTVKTVLTHAAAQGLCFAQSLSTFSYGAEKYELSRSIELYTTRKRVAEEVLKFPRAALGFLTDLRGRPNFEKYKHFSDEQTDEHELLEALVLIPGESAHIVDELKLLEFAGHNDWIDHPHVCAKSSPTCKTPRLSPDQNASHSSSALLAQFPIIIEVAVSFRFSFPGLPQVKITGKAAGYAERMARFPEKPP